MAVESSREAELEQKIKQLQKVVTQYEAFANSVETPPFINGIVVGMNENTVDITSGGKPMEVRYSTRVDRERLKIGQGVSLDPKTSVVVGFREKVPGGTIYSNIHEVLPDGRIVIKENGQSHILSVANDLKLSSGDRIVCDSGFNVVLEGLGKGTTRYDLEEVRETPWSSLGGLERQIADLRQAIEEPYEKRELYAKYGRRPSKGVLLEGPPGCGKTHLARAAAYNLSERLGTGKGFFLELGGPEIKDPFYGVSEGMVREFFARGREISNRNGDVAIGFIDEADALFPRRGYGSSADTSVTDTFLYEMDGLSNQSGFVLMLATNRPEALDSAVTRRGRIDTVIDVGRPNREAAESIFGIYLNNTFLNGASVDELAKHAARDLYSNGHHLFDINYGEGGAALDFMDNPHPVYLKDLSSGALVESIVYGAADIAMRREMNEGEQYGGVTKNDLTSAIRKEYGIHSRMKHTIEYAHENIPSSRSRPINSITLPNRSSEN